MTVRVLVVGAGFMGSLHARTVHGSRQARLCGVVDRDASVARALGAELGVAAFTDLGRAIEETAPHAAIVATPDPAYRASAETAIEAGLALLVEKPLATTVSDAEAITRLAKEHGTRLMPGHLLRFDLRYAQLADAVRAGDLGRPVVVDAARWGLKTFGARVSDVTSPLWHFLIHDIDAVQWIGGSVIQHVDGAVRVDSAAGLSAFTATGALASGAVFQLAAGWTLPAGCPSPRMTFELHGERAHANLVAHDEGLTVADEERVSRGEGAGWPTFHGRIDGMLRREIEHFVSALADDTPFAVTPEEAVDAVRGAVALELAAVTRRIG